MRNIFQYVGYLIKHKESWFLMLCSMIYAALLNKFICKNELESMYTPLENTFLLI
jgi:hypothetical protein